MLHQQAVLALSAIAHEGRLALFRHLVQSTTEVSAGDLATALAMPNSTLSFHLKNLTHADLVKVRQEGRFMYYSPNREAFNGLLSYLTENCCGGAGCPTSEMKDV